MDRPPRKTKVVNYCDSNDFDDNDEDFLSAKAPPSKKAREGVKQQEQKKSSSKSSSQETDSEARGSSKSRGTLDDKSFDRDLEAALTLSLLQASDGKQDHLPSSTEHVADTLPGADNVDPSVQRLSNCSVNTAVLGLDKIAEEQGSPCPPSRERRVVSKPTEQQKSSLKEDEDYQPNLTPDSESDDEFSEPAESEDEEFAVKKVNKATKKGKKPKNEKSKKPPVLKKEKQATKTSKAKLQATGPPILKKETQTTETSKAKRQATAATKPGRSPPLTKPASEPRQALTPTTVSITKPVSPAGGRIPKWNPPGQIGGSPSSSQTTVVKSPGQGLRLGLSRLVRVKPLHPSVPSH
ncbi:RAD51-associated protein 1 [Lampris incognitus]|uniref:RAD51-associated protein 1 n=1 Tax=Lampris incognitus TaxID=2546036 RepID=UPI0024B612B1|nr:RAD51-associated protein 1 [Lampris incognitus]